MIRYSIILTVIYLFITMSCMSQDKKFDYVNCMQDKLEGTGINFYQKIGKIENKLLKMEALSSNDKNGYIEAFESLIIKNNDEKWNEYYIKVKESLLLDFNLEYTKLQLLSFCSDLQTTKKNTKCNCVNIQKYFLKKLTYKNYNDNETLDGLLLFTDFGNKTLRLNITFVLLLNMENKYEN